MLMMIDVLGYGEDCEFFMVFKFCFNEWIVYECEVDWYCIIIIFYGWLNGILIYVDVVFGFIDFKEWDFWILEGELE